MASLRLQHLEQQQGENIREQKKKQPHTMLFKVLFKV